MYQDTDGDGNPANATLIGGPFAATILMTNTFQTYPVNLVVPGPTGDIYLGFEDTWAEAGDFQPRLFPAAIDTSSGTQMRSWIAGMNDVEPATEA